MRIGNIKRSTKETIIDVSINLDGNGNSKVDTKIGFFNHMIDSLSRHSGFDISLKCDGDLNVDTHHSIEDCGICLGLALNKALEGSVINRYYSTYMCMDDALVLCSIDICNRGYYMQDYHFSCEKVGDLETECINEFFYSFAQNAKMNLHFVIIRGENNHHIIECMFKALAVSLKNACTKSDRLLSTKGTL